MQNVIKFSEDDAKAVYAALLNSVDAVARGHGDHIHRWGNPAIPSQQAERSALRVELLKHEAALSLVKAKLTGGGYHGR